MPNTPGPDAASADLPAAETDVAEKDTQASPADPIEDPLKKQFREALARKQANPSGASGGQGAGGPHLGTNGAAHAQRMFRRKSGG